MDESWTMGMGVATRLKPKPSLPRRRSTEETSARRAVFGAESEAPHPEDFSDVFGGPPRTVLLRQFSTCDLNRSPTPFYEEIFRKPEAVVPARTGRNLPVFRIPASRERSQEFYSDIFGKEDDVRRSRSRSKSKSKSKSKSNSSSVLSSEELSPLPVADDGSFWSFSSKLRPINVPCRWNSSTMVPEGHRREHGIPSFPWNQSSQFDNLSPQLDNLSPPSEYIENFRTSHFGFSRQDVSPETISLDPNSYRSIKVPMDDLEHNSPSSVVSSLCQDLEAKASKFQDKGLQEQESDLEQEENEVMSSYIIEINAADHTEETEEARGINEAIAWVKEKFYTSDKIWSKHEKVHSAESGISGGQMDGDKQTGSPVEEELNKWAQDGKEQPQIDMEVKLLDEEIRSWSAGKEANIHLLLSTLHQILWAKSGWYAIPLTNLVEGSQVKKAYQKARLCLHPDKLQQRGATIKQKYVAEKAFSVLQEAWAAYISQDVFFG